MVEYTIFANKNLIYSSVEPDRGALLSPQLKMEVNKSGSLSFVMLPNHEYFDTIQPMKTVITVYEDTSIIFFGRVIEAPVDFYRQKKVTCEGALSFLLDTVITPFTFDKKNQKTIRQIFRHIVHEHNTCLDGQDAWKQFSIDDTYVTVTPKENGTVDDTDYWEYKSYGDTFSTLTSELVDVYGGILRTRHNAEIYGDYESVTNYLDYIKDPSQNPEGYRQNNQAIEFGVNLLDFEAEYPVSDIFTVLMPIGSDKLTISSVNNDSPYLVNQEAVNKFGRIVKVQQWSGIKKADELKTKAQRYLDYHTKVYTDNLKIKAIDLHYFSDAAHQLKLLDKVQVYSEPHDIGTNEPLVLFCLSAELDLQNPENNSYLLGSHIPEYKDKAELTQKSSSGRSAGGGRASSLGTPTLSGIQTAVEEDIHSTIEEVYENNVDAVKGIFAMLGDKVSDVLGIDISQISGGIGEKVSAFFSGLGIGNSEGPEGVEVPNLTELIEDAVGSFAETTDATGRLNGSVGIKTLSDITDDVVDINGREIHIGNVDGTTSKISIRARDIEITDALDTYIGGHKIIIGDGQTDLIRLQAEELKLEATTLIENLIVKNLTAETIETGWLYADKTIRAKTLWATDQVISNEVVASSVYAGDFLQYVEPGIYDSVATQTWVESNYPGRTSMYTGSGDTRYYWGDLHVEVTWVTDDNGVARRVIYLP